MKDCNYPNCLECDHICDMDKQDIETMLKRRRYANNPDLYRKKQQEYRKRIRANLPHCDNCDMCVLVKKDKGDGFRRVCTVSMRLVEQKVSNSPRWCCLRRKEVNNGI